MEEKKIRIPGRAKRNEIYRQALKGVKSSLMGDGTILGTIGMCYHLTYSGSNNDRWSAYYNMERFFPEIWKHFPKEEGLSGMGYWFPEDDYRSRIAILEQAIAETKPGKKKL